MHAYIQAACQIPHLSQYPNNVVFYIDSGSADSMNYLETSIFSF